MHHGGTESTERKACLSGFNGCPLCAAKTRSPVFLTSISRCRKRGQKNRQPKKNKKGERKERSEHAVWDSWFFPCFVFFRFFRP